VGSERRKNCSAQLTLLSYLHARQWRWPGCLSGGPGVAHRLRVASPACRCVGFDSRRRVSMLLLLLLLLLQVVNRFLSRRCLCVASRTPGATANSWPGSPWGHEKRGCVISMNWRRTSRRSQSSKRKDRTRQDRRTGVISAGVKEELHSWRRQGTKDEIFAAFCTR
jgi:hypothetical protein